jgi:hypothetical protein
MPRVHSSIGLLADSSTKHLLSYLAAMLSWLLLDVLSSRIRLGSIRVTKGKMQGQLRQQGRLNPFKQPLLQALLLRSGREQGCKAWAVHGCVALRQSVN